MKTFLRGPGTRGRRKLPAPLVFSLIVATAAACLSNSVTDPGKAGPAVSHVHALVTNPADGSLLAATHQGVLKIEGGKATLVGKGRQDTMGLAVRGPDRFYASGHPEAGADSPPHLGLIASDDGTETWRTMSLAGQADFHTLAPTENGVYGYNSVASMLMYSGDGEEWTDLFRGAMHDIAVDPDDPDHLLLTTEKGVEDYRRGSDPKVLAETEGIALIEWVDERTVVGLTVDGRVLTSTDAGKRWTDAGRVSGDIEALGADTDGWQVATTDGIFESTDQGKSWRSILDLP